jgi:hypothetical protein
MRAIIATLSLTMAGAWIGARVPSSSSEAVRFAVIGDSERSFQAVSRTGKTVDSGIIHREVRR